MRWIWIDTFLEFHPGKSARALKNLSSAEDHFAEHFPGYPIMPASLILEGLAQTGGILVGEANNFQEKVVLAKITSSRFTREALAGETLIYDVELMTLRTEGASVKGRVTVQDTWQSKEDSAADETSSPSEKNDCLAEAEIFFAHLDKSRSGQLFGDRNFVFTGELKNLLGLARLAAEKTADEGTSDNKG